MERRSKEEALLGDGVASQPPANANDEVAANFAAFNAQTEANKKDQVSLLHYTPPLLSCTILRLFSPTLYVSHYTLPLLSYAHHTIRSASSLHNYTRHTIHIASSPDDTPAHSHTIALLPDHSLKTYEGLRL
jgi:hypothetical protein